MRTEADSAPDEATGRLRLKAADAADLQILSAALQDAVVPLVDMVYLGDDQAFALVVNRFRWEAQSAEGGHPERVLCGISFAGVESVRRRGLAKAAVDGFLSLLAIEVAGPDGPSVTIELRFAGEAAIQLQARTVECRLEDLGEPWPTQWRPDHS